MAKKKSSAGNSESDDTDETVDFEDSLHEVERIVARLESGELGLTQSLEQYESGIRELKRCHALLDAAEQRVSLLSGFDADGNPVVGPLDDDPTPPRAVKKKKVRVRKRVPTAEKPEGADDSLKRTQRRPDSVDDSPGLF
ncbi:MAG: exodeoxyribonuclease VII small subunit [Rubripirellula sp.]